MNQKIVNEPYDYSAQLYDLYSKGKEACSIFQVEIRRLTDNINPEKDALSWPNEDRKRLKILLRGSIGSRVNGMGR